MTDGCQHIVAMLGKQLARQSVTSVSRASGLSRAGIYKALTAGNHPSFNTIERIADALGYRVALQRKE